MIIRVSAVTALLFFAAVSCDTEANNRQQRIIRKPPPDSTRFGPGPPQVGPSFRPPSNFRQPNPTAAASAKKPVFANRPKGPAIGPKVEYGFTPISSPVGAESAQAPQQVENNNKKPLIINVQSAPPSQNGPASFSFQNSNQQVVEGTFKEKPSFAPPKQTFSAQPQQSSDTQLGFGGAFSFNQPVGAKINFEPEQPAFSKNPFQQSFEGSVITAGPPKPAAQNNFPAQPDQPPSFPSFNKDPSSGFPSFNKEPSNGFSNSRPREQASFSKQPPPQGSFVKAPPKPGKEHFANFPPQHQKPSNERFVGEGGPFRAPSFESKKVIHAPPPPIFRGPPPPAPSKNKLVHQKPNPSFEIQKASVIGPFSGPPVRTLKPVSKPPPPPQKQGPSQPPKVAPTNTQENPEFSNFPPPGFGSGQPIHQEVKTQVAPVQHLPAESPNFAQESNPQIFNQNYQTVQVQQARPQPPQVPQIPSHIQLQLPANNGPAGQGQQHHFQFQNTQPQFQNTQPQFQNTQPQFQNTHNQPQFQLPANFHNAQPQLQLPAGFQNNQPQLQLPAGFQNVQLPASFGAQQDNKFANPFLNAFPSSHGGAGIPQFSSLPQRLNPATLGGFSAPGVASQLGLPSAYSQFNPGLAQLYKGILPVQQFPAGTAAGSNYPFPSAGVNPFLNPLRSSVPTALSTHSSGGVPQFQPLPNSLNFPDQDEDEQDLAASHKHKKVVAAPLDSGNNTKSKKTTLKDILAEDCKGAEDFGYCASPPRYPTQQIKTVLKQCAEELAGILEQAEEHHVAKRETTAPEQFTWTTEACSSTMATVEPGYARDSKGKWLVVVQQASKGVHQRVDVDVCGSEGGDCGCKQYFETKNLVAWDPDHPNDCPTVRTFKFPSKCDCPPQQ
ncbi:uncharacterized protein LOC135946655 [Cloeon dipterum]|uniref:uncharacterized protein LOC135946655 n=1 Tax=Cloeon dipterum TaxID=197152 RepID=UPI0032209824